MALQSIIIISYLGFIKQRRLQLKKVIFVALVAMLMAGCASVTKNKYAIISTQSLIGFSAGIKDTNQTPEIKLAYARGETVFIPVDGDKVAPVLARLNYQSIWSKGGGIASTVSTGKAAINQSCFREGVGNEDANEGK